MALRLPCAPLKLNVALNSMYFNDGSQKCLAGFIVWIALCIVAQKPEYALDLEHPSIVGLAASLLRIRTILKGSTSCQDELDSAVARIVKQNVDAKVQPVSSLTWACILKQLGERDFEAAMGKYNSHPEVVAFEASHGSGGIVLDNKKKKAGKPSSRFFQFVNIMNHAMPAYFANMN